MGNAIVVPPTSEADFASGAGVVASLGGGFDYVRGTGVRRYSRELVPRPQTNGLVANQSIPQAIFGGFAFQHFGHFLLESLSRVWIEQTQEIDDSVPLVWIGGHGVSAKHWMSDICRQIGLNREVMIIDSSTGALAVEELLVPQASCELHEWIHPQQLRRLGTTSWRPSGSESKVWLSRGGLGVSKGGISEEAEMESVLVELGWSIFRPEDLSIASQVELLASASHVAGIEGSALHGLVLVGGFGGTIDIVQRNSNRNFKLVALAGGWDQRVFDPIGGASKVVPALNSLTGDNVGVRVWEGIDFCATALLIDRSSRRNVRP